VVRGAICSTGQLAGACAEDSAPPTFRDRLRNLTPEIPQISLPEMPSVSLPSLPALSMPDLSGISDSNGLIQEVGSTLPLLESMGYEVATFRVQWSVPPRAKLRLRSNNVSDVAALESIDTNAPGGVISKALLTSALTAKRIQSNMKLGTAIIDVDLALNPKIRMSF
jgi:hypothetical protein